MYKVILGVLLVSQICYGGESADLLVEKADKLRKERKKEEAKNLYIEAAEKGYPAANFALAYYYSIDSESNFKIAALSGHEVGLKEYLDEVFFRAGTLKKANPDSALKVYKEAKKVNPTIKLYQEQKAIETISKCVEAGIPDMSALSIRYGANPEDSGWKWAKVVSSETTDSKLTLQLVCRGGVVPAELKWAIDDYYKNWKTGAHSVFDGCSYAQAKATMSFCSKSGY